jgi:hypothetical protein
MRGVRRGLVVLVALAALLVAGDRIAAWAAQQAVADQVAAELATYQVGSARPETSFGGFPFLTQVAAGRYEEVSLRLRDVGSGPLRLPLVELTAFGVTASARTLVNRSGPIDAERVEGAATIGYEQVRAITGRPDLVLAPDDGRLTVRLPVELLGQSLTLVGTASVEAAPDVVRIRVDGLTALEPSGLPPGAGPLVEAIGRELSVDVPLPPLPYGLSVDSVRAEPSGLVVTVSAREVPLSR